MNKEEFLKLIEYLVRLVRRGADPARAAEPVPVKPDGIAWEQVYALAEKHSLSVAAFRALQAANNPIENRPEKALWDKWENFCRMQAMADIQQLYAWEELSATFSDRGLKLLPLKGLHIKHLYSETYVRQMGDLDILYEKGCFKKVRAAMEELGYAFDKNSENHHHQVFSRAPVTEAELHRDLLPDSSVYAAYYADPWAKARPTDVPYIYRYALEDEYVFMLVHSVKHFTGGGSGIRTALDFYLFTEKYKAELDRDYIDAEIKRADEIRTSTENLGAGGAGLVWEEGETSETIAEFEKIILSVAYGWFGGEDVKTDEKGLMMASDGVYGKSEHIWKKNLNAHEKTYFFRRLFPSYAYLKTWNPILNKAPFLLPYVWLKRIVRGIFCHGKKLRAEYRWVKAEKKRKKQEEKAAKKEKKAKAGGDG